MGGQLQFYVHFTINMTSKSVEQHIAEIYYTATLLICYYYENYMQVYMAAIFNFHLSYAPNVSIKTNYNFVYL